MRIGCVLMAAGLGSRFGGDKLLYELGGRSLLTRMLAAAPASLFDRAVAIVSDDRVAKIASEVGYTVLFNREPALGQGRTIRMGTQAMQGLHAAMFCVCDQPHLSTASVRKLKEAYLPDLFFALSYGGRRGNPVIFPAWSYPELLALADHETGKMVLRQYPDQICLVQAHEEKELMDIDTREDLDYLVRWAEDPPIDFAGQPIPARVPFSALTQAPDDPSPEA